MSTSSLSIAVSALKAHSYAIDTTSHNIANASTPGYRRERVDLRAAYPRMTGIGMMGAGVDPQRVSRAVDRLADERVRRAGSTLQSFTARNEVASLAEDVFGEPDRGITKSMSGLFDSFATLATAPTDSASRSQVVSSLQDFASRVNEIRGGLEGVTADATVRLRSEIDTANQIAKRVAEINTYARTPGGLPADLADELDKSLDTLATSVGAIAETQSDGRVRVTINGRALVDSDRAIPMSVPDTPPGQVDHPTGPLTLGGTAGGLQTAIQGDLGDYRSRLDTFVDQITTEMNDLHASGFTTGGVQGGALFDQVDGRVQVLISDPADLAASKAADAPLDASIADQMAQIRTGTGGKYRDVVSFVANSVASLGRSNDTAQAISDSAGALRDSQIGVNMDEELTNMMAEQRAYQAAARVISVTDEMLDTLIRM